MLRRPLSDWMEVSRLRTSPLLTLPPRLSPGDTVALLAPASWAEGEWIDQTARRLTDWGWKVRLGEHLRDLLGHLAGNDSDRLSDLNGAIRDPRDGAVLRGATSASGANWMVTPGRAKRHRP